MNNRILRLLIILILFIVPSQIFAQPSGPPGGGPGGPGGPNPCWPPPCVPIDNGILVLLFLGFLYGAWKLYSFSKKLENVVE